MEEKPPRILIERMITVRCGLGRGRSPQLGGWAVGGSWRPCLSIYGSQGESLYC